MSFGKKKKKKQVTVAAPGEEATVTGAGAGAGGAGEVRSNADWQTSDRDYDYFELLDRMQQMLLNEGKSSSTFKVSRFFFSLFSVQMCSLFSNSIQITRVIGINPISNPPFFFSPSPLSHSPDSKLRLPPPDLVRDGTTKTVWANFPVVCKKLHRSLDHVLEYTLAELGTNGSIDGSQRLTIR